MSASRHTLDSGKVPGSRKVMVYIAANVHRAMAQVALDEDRSTSSVYVEAALALLQANGRRVEADPAAIAVPPVAAAAQLVKAIERQGERIAELQAAVASIRGAGLHKGQAPAGTKVAEAMKVVLGILRTAGPAGMTTRDLDAAAYAVGVRSGTVESARAVLRGAEVIRCEAKRWSLVGA